MKTVELAPGLRVPLITVSDWIEIADAAWEEERVALVADLESSGSEPAARLEALRDHRLRQRTANVLLVATFRLTYAADIVRRACFKANANPEAVLGSMTPGQMIEAAQALCGYGKADEGNAASPPATA